jgi:hypothetical protein
LRNGRWAGTPVIETGMETPDKQGQGEPYFPVITFSCPALGPIAYGEDSRLLIQLPLTQNVQPPSERLLWHNGFLAAIGLQTASLNHSAVAFWQMPNDRCWPDLLFDNSGRNSRKVPNASR